LMLSVMLRRGKPRRSLRPSGWTGASLDT
jgi:hypothetical protein